MCDTPLEQCDVVDKHNLENFRSKRSKWLNWLNGDDPNAVWNQIHAMEWNHRVFLMIDESRRLASEQSMPSAALNPLLSQFVDEGYVAFQALAIRKQLEKANKNKKRQIVSLRRAIDDIYENRTLITRECYVSYDGLPFDYEPVRQAHANQIIGVIQERRRNGEEGTGFGGSLPSKGPHAWRSSERRHALFDQLANVEKNHRSRADEIDSDVFDFLKNSIDQYRAPFIDVKEFANKYVAHAADKEAISTLSKDQHGLAIAKVEKCQKRLWQVTQFVISTILYDTYIVPGIHYQGNPLENLEKPWLEKDKTDELHEFWDEVYTERDNWPAEYYRDFVSRS